ncbi:MAG: isoprenylcysteine carboxylmethyltransferase family protein [Bacteroidales bacterium]|nr:isoprenylcysteine carboxylmethyltransferase family protein [Bacteroidales bacterium]
MKTSLFIKQAFGTLLFFAIIFVSAGSLFYWQGWVYVIIGFFMFIMNFTVFKLDPALLEERSKLGEGAKKWDKLILGLTFLATIIMYIIAGLDSGRFHWSPDFHLSASFIGIILTITGQLLFLIAQKQNKFFSSTVRIQTDRGHTVCESGLYKVVRHPAYLGSVIQTIGFPLLFGSLWSIIPVCISIVLLLTRTYLEDKTLINELKGYIEYSFITRYKLIPYIW